MGYLEYFVKFCNCNNVCNLKNSTFSNRVLFIYLLPQRDKFGNLHIMSRLPVFSCSLNLIIFL